MKVLTTWPVTAAAGFAVLLCISCASQEDPDVNSPPQARPESGTTLPPELRFRDMRTGEEVVTEDIRPINSLEDLIAEGGVVLGEGSDQIITWVADQKIRPTIGLPSKEWRQMQKGLSADAVRNLLGEPGFVDDLGDSQVWWYRYSEGGKRSVGFHDGVVFDWN